MKTQLKEIAAFTFASVLSTTLIVACGQTKDAAKKASKISINAMSKDAQDQQNPQAQDIPHPRFSVHVTDQKPMLSIMQSALGDKLDPYMKDQSAIQENIGLDLTLANLDGSSITAAASGATSPGSGSVLVLQTTLNNTSNQPIVMTMQSRTVMIDVKDSKVTATFTFMPESKMRTDMMTVILDGTIDNTPLSVTKNYSGTVSVMDANSNKSQIGTFSLPVAQIMSDKDAAVLTENSSTASAAAKDSSDTTTKADDK